MTLYICLINCCSIFQTLKCIRDCSFNSLKRRNDEKVIRHSLWQQSIFFPKCPSLTYFLRIKKARLDFFRSSVYLYTNLEESSFLPGYRTDHSYIFMSLEYGKSRKGLSYWKFKNSLLRDET